MAAPEARVAALEGNAPFPAASLIKVPIMVEAYRQAAAGRISLGSRVRVGSEAMVTGAGVLQHLTPGLRLPVADLVALMITASDNTATNLLIDLLGADQVNATMAGLGLARTVLYNKLQVLAVGSSGENTTCTDDMTRLMSLIGGGAVVSWEACRRMVALLKGQQHRQGLPACLPPAAPPAALAAPGVAAGAGPGDLPAWELGHKPGWTSRVFHDTGLLFIPGRTVAVAVLTAGLPRPAAQALVARAGRAVYDWCSEPPAGADTGADAGGGVGGGAA